MPGALRTLGRGILGPALGIHLLGWGSAVRGWTLDGPVPLGGGWGWKSAEALVFVLGEEVIKTRNVFGGFWLASLLLALGLRRWPGPLRWVASALLMADLAVCAAVGDLPNIGIHALGLLLLWTLGPSRKDIGAGDPIPGPIAS